MHLRWQSLSVMVVLYNYVQTTDVNEQDTDTDTPYVCLDGETQIEKEKVCDGSPDCPMTEKTPGGDDEEDCSTDVRSKEEESFTACITTTVIDYTTRTTEDEED